MPPVDTNVHPPEYHDDGVSLERGHRPRFDRGPSSCRGKDSAAAVVAISFDRAEKAATAERDVQNLYTCRVARRLVTCGSGATS